MPTWGQIGQELAQLQAQMGANTSPSAFDVLRRKYIKRLYRHTGRAVIVYGTPWMESLPPQMVGLPMDITLGDIQGYMETCYDVAEDELDLILTSPGGFPEAAEAIMDYLRTQFTHIRVIVPVAAMSAATMMSLAADEIVMGKHSQLGPIDPQITIQTPEGPRSAPGQAILDQFEMAKAQCADPANIAAWLPMLRSLGPGLLSFCEAQRDLGRNNARTALERHMFAGDPDAARKAEEAASYFADFSSFKSHGRRVNREDARKVHLKVTNLEADKVLQDLVLSLHHAMRHSFTGAGVFKLFENHLDHAYIESVQAVVEIPGQPMPQNPGPAQLPPASPPALTRQQRRANERAGKKR